MGGYDEAEARRAAFLEARQAVAADLRAAITDAVIPCLLRAADPKAIAAAIRAQKVPCREHSMPFPKPSCWQCGRNGAFERAARITEDHDREIANT